MREVDMSLDKLIYWSLNGLFYVVTRHHWLSNFVSVNIIIVIIILLLIVHYISITLSKTMMELVKILNYMLLLVQLGDGQVPTNRPSNGK